MDNDTYIEIRPDVFAIQDGDVRMYLICGAQYALLLDTGYGNENLPALLHTLCTKPIIVAHTHTHQDHIGADHLFSKIYASPTEFGNLRQAGISQDALLPLHQGDRFDLGGRVLTVQEMPGHTACSLMFSDEQNRLLFTGDTVADVPVYLCMPGADLTAYERSLQWLLAHQDKYDVFLGCHGTAEQYPVNARRLLACVQSLPEKTGTLERYNAYGDVFFQKYSYANASILLPLDFHL